MSNSRREHFVQDIFQSKRGVKDDVRVCLQPLVQVHQGPTVRNLAAVQLIKGFVHFAEFLWTGIDIFEEFPEANGCIVNLIRAVIEPPIQPSHVPTVEFLKGHHFVHVQLDLLDACRLARVWNVCHRLRFLLFIIQAKPCPAPFIFFR
jgi:hypothetical protein